ncbi:hypothetical protein JTE90_027651 [Oedothorax gibbosus]|uniref:Uncharacterized protein n=1 Tax=Oedothorax gibbosus TaxID=931172 RepID=A0AAV6UU22_9ARAC|nr:hypothetical protein JTE90_027651 [Oedothorax gibbosus]
MTAYFKISHHQNNLISGGRETVKLWLSTPTGLSHLSIYSAFYKSSPPPLSPTPRGRMEHLFLRSIPPLTLGADLRIGR